ncbi:hypothetical protein ACHAXS_013234 [Conticribra weissflogii]
MKKLVDDSTLPGFTTTNMYLIVRDLLSPLRCFALVLVIVPVYFTYVYWKSIRSKLKAMEDHLAVRIIRVTDTSMSLATSPKSRRVVCMELDAAFVRRCQNCAASPIPVMSLGQYLTQLRLEGNRDGSVSKAVHRAFIQTELTVTLAKGVMAKLGATYGAALLPFLSGAVVAGNIESAASGIAHFLAKSIVDNEDVEDEGGNNIAKRGADPAAFDLNLLEFSAMANLNQKTNTKTNSDVNQSAGECETEIETEIEKELENEIEKKQESTSPQECVSPLEYLKRGESGRGRLAYDRGPAGDFPSEANGDTYDPDDRSFPPPDPIHPRLLPGLHLGHGDLKCTHTKREGIEHRLLCVLLNKLSYNVYRMTRHEPKKDFFTVKCAGKSCHFPDQLVQALVDCGHRVQVCPRVLPTNFGISLCIKENDGTYTYIPTAFMSQTGIERASDGRPAYFAAPHGGMDVNISGPIVGSYKRKPAWIQFYVSIGGLTCFHPDEDAEAPWTEKTSLTDPYTHELSIAAVRMCSYVAVTFNRIATEMKLPFGGYAVLGMCNDSATFIDLALRGQTNSYPLVSSGRYLIHIVDYLIKMKEDLKTILSQGDYPEDEGRLILRDIECLIRATCSLPSDLHISPKTLLETTRRHNVTFSNPVFRLTTEAKQILTETADLAREFVE